MTLWELLRSLQQDPDPWRAVPLLVCGVATLAAAWWLMRAPWRFWRDHGRGAKQQPRCTACGYALVGLSGEACPECGADLTRPHGVWATGEPKLWRWLAQTAGWSVGSLAVLGGLLGPAYVLLPQGYEVGEAYAVKRFAEPCESYTLRRQGFAVRWFWSQRLIAEPELGQTVLEIDRRGRQDVILYPFWGFPEQDQPHAWLLPWDAQQGSGPMPPQDQGPLTAERLATYLMPPQAETPPLNTAKQILQRATEPMDSPINGTQPGEAVVQQPDRYGSIDTWTRPVGEITLRLIIAAIGLTLWAIGVWWLQREPLPQTGPLKSAR